MIASAHIIGGGALGGAELFYVRLVNTLQARGQPVLAINLPCGRSRPGCKPMSRKLTYQCGESASAVALANGVIPRAHRLDIVQTYMGRATRLTHLDPVSVPIHVARLGGYYALKGYRHAHAWVGNTQGICDYLVSNGLPAARIAHIGNFVDIPIASAPNKSRKTGASMDIPEDALVLVAVRRSPGQGLRESSTALAMLEPRLYHHRWFWSSWATVP